jgi:hypothetical protein
MIQELSSKLKQLDNKTTPWEDLFIHKFCNRADKELPVSDKEVTKAEDIILKYQTFDDVLSMIEKEK